MKIQLDAIEIQVSQCPGLIMVQQKAYNTALKSGGLSPSLHFLGLSSAPYPPKNKF